MSIRSCTAQFEIKGNSPIAVVLECENAQQLLDELNLFGLNASLAPSSITSAAGSVSAASTKPGPVADPKPVKPSKAADSTPTATVDQAAAQQPKPETSKPTADTTATTAAPTIKTYAERELGSKIAKFMGERASTGYADRRAKMVALLTEFGVKTGPEIAADKLDSFEAKLTTLTTPVAATAPVPEEALG